MAESVGSEFAELIPLALVIAISPLSIIPGILMLNTPRPKPTSLAFLAGWVLGIAVVTGAFVGGTGRFQRMQGWDNKPSWAPYVRIVIGAALIAFAAYRWFGRHRAAHNPKWLTSMSSAPSQDEPFSPASLLTVANLKVPFAMCAAAGAAIGTAGTGPHRGLAGSGRLHRTGGLVGRCADAGLSGRRNPTRRSAEPGQGLDGERNHTVMVVGILLVIGLQACCTREFTRSSPPPPARWA